MKLATETRTALGLWLAGAVILGLALLAYENTRAAARDSRSVWHMHDVIEGIEGTLSAIADAAAAVRGYEITGDESHLATQQSARSRVKEHLEQLKGLTSDNPRQKQRLASMESHIAARLDLLEQGIELRRREGFESANRFVQTGRGGAEMDQIRRVAAQMREEEEGLLKQREEAYERRSRGTLQLIATLGVFVFLLLGAVYYMVARDIRGRRRAERALRESEQRYALVAENLPHGAVHVFDKELRYLFSAGQVLKELGLSNEFLTGKSIFDVLPPESAQLCAVNYRRALDSGERVTFEGDYAGRSFLVNALPMRDADGTHSQLLVLATDITARKAAEEEIQRANRFLDSVVENIPNMVFIKDARELKFVQMNKAGEELTGLSRGELLGKSDYDLFLKEEADFFVAKDREVLESSALLDIPEETLRTKRQGVRILHTKKIPILDAAGRPAYLLGVSEDITERKQMDEELRRYQKELEEIVRERTAEVFHAHESLKKQFEENQRTLEALRESEQRLALHVMQSPMAAIEWNQDLRVTEWNLAAEKVFGYTRAEALGRDSSFIVAESAREQVKRVASDLLARRGGTRSTNENVTKDGRTILCEWYSAPLVDKDGRVVGVASLANDITDYKKLEEQFRQSQKMEAVGLLAGGIAHDFNNLLNVILGYCDILLEDMGSEDARRKKIELIKSSGVSAATLTRQLLAFSRKQVLEPRVVSLDDILRDMDHLLRRVIGEDIELQRYADPSLGMVKVDPGQMEQVILNLAVNARDAMPRGGKLTLEAANVTIDEEYGRTHAASSPGEYVMLGISDTGIGMDQATQKRIFEPFFTTKAPGKGTGLGLSTVYGIVKQSGGYIWVYSEPGKGTTFKIYLPRVYEKPEALAAAEPVQAETRGAETILVVEDDEALRELACEYLTSQGYTALAACNGAEAIRIAERHRRPIELVITDVVLPGMSGPELARKLKKLRPQIKALFVSGYTQNAIVHNGTLEPRIEFVQKPYKPSDLARKIRSILEHGSGSAK